MSIQLPVGKNWLQWVLITSLHIIGYGLVGYVFPRSSFVVLLMLYVLLCSIYGYLSVKASSKEWYWFLLLQAVVVRAVLLFAVPTLSDDYFRFAWDGWLTNAGVNPYQFVPGDVGNTQVETTAFTQSLKAGMNSLPYYSPYPPVLQFIFYCCVKVGGQNLLANVVGLRLVGWVAELITCVVAAKLLAQLGMKQHRVFWYALNPLVVLELTGNLHGEVIMLCFVVCSLYWLAKEQNFVAALLLGLAIATKLLPLVLLPVIVAYLGVKKGFIFSVVAILVAGLCFLPFITTGMVQHISQSIGYYFQLFEFNASIYYLFRWAGYEVTGFNLIIVFGKLMPLLAIVMIGLVAWYKKINTLPQLLERVFLTFFVYFLCSLIVHPWYITSLVLITVFTRWRFALVWSGIIFVTYSAYRQVPYEEIWWLTALEYLLLALVVYKEWMERNRAPAVATSEPA